jgi:hypothetical protein
VEFHGFLELIINIYFMDLMLCERDKYTKKIISNPEKKKNISMYVKKIFFSLFSSYSCVYNIWNNYNNYFQTTIKFLSISLRNRCSKNTIVFLLSLTVFLYEDRFFLFIPIIVLKPGPVRRVDPGPGLKKK